MKKNTLIKRVINKLYKIAFKPPNLTSTMKFLIDNSEKKIVLDIGANRGQTIEWFQKNFANVDIYAFEPTRELFNDLSKKYKNFENINLFSKAISNKTGVEKFFVSELSVTNSLLKPITDNYNGLLKNDLIDKFKKIDSYNVEVTTLENWYKNTISGALIDILKTDTQGNDYKVLIGGESVLRDFCKSVIIEIQYQNYYENQGQIYDIIKYLYDLGFVIFSIYDNTRLSNGFLTESDYIFINTKYFNLNILSKKLEKK